MHFNTDHTCMCVALKRIFSLHVAIVTIEKVIVDYFCHHKV